MCFVVVVVIHVAVDVVARCFLNIVAVGVVVVVAECLFFGFFPI